MSRIVEYGYNVCPLNTDLMKKLGMVMKEDLANGWQPYGSPIALNGHLVQAMVKYEPGAPIKLSSTEGAK